MSILRGAPRIISCGILLALTLPGHGEAGGDVIARTHVELPDRDRPSGPGGRDIVAPVHVELRASDPPRDATLDRAPDEISLHFTGAVQAGLSRIDVIGPDGRALEVDAVEHPAPDAPESLRASLPSGLPAGTYRVDWRTAAMDGHVVQGSFTFRVADRESPEDPLPGEPEGPPRERLPEPEAAPGPGPDAAPRAPVPGQGLVPEGTGTRWLQLLGTILLLGVVASRFGVLPLVTRHEDLHDLGLRLRKGFWRAGWFAVAVLLLALPARLYVEFWGAGPSWTAGEITDRLFTTAWGAGWFLHLGVVALGGLGLVLAGQRGEHTRGWVILGMGALLLPLVATLQGHAWGVEELRPLALVAQYLHVAAVGIWLGGLILLLVVGLAAVRTDAKHRAKLEGEGEGVVRGEDVRPPLARLVNAFSRMVLPAVAIFLVTGVPLAWIHTGGVPQNLVGTQYGRTLLLKLALVAGALALGFYNWRRVRPGLAERPDPGALRIPASIEAVLALLVLLITAVLVALSPPG